jgi:hypothetical protein
MSEENVQNMLISELDSTQEEIYISTFHCATKEL